VLQTHPELIQLKEERKDHLLFWSWGVRGACLISKLHQFTNTFPRMASQPARRAEHCGTGQGLQAVVGMRGTSVTVMFCELLVLQR